MKKNREKPASSKSSSYQEAVRNVTLLGLGANLTLALFKGGVGVFASSQALIADAVHSLSDLATDLAVLVGVRFWAAPPDEEHPYGHGRLETLISFFIGLALGAVGVGIVWNALSTLHAQEDSTPGWPAFIVACAAVLIKELVYRATMKVAKAHKSRAILANAWHHRSDALSSVPVAFSVAGVYINPSWAFLDQVAAVIVAVLILHASWSIAYPAFRQLIDAGADADERKGIESIALDTEGVKGVHALRTRHMGSGLQIDIHIQVDGNLSVHRGHAIAGAVKQRLLHHGPSVVDVLIHIEPFGQGARLGRG